MHARTSVLPIYSGRIDRSENERMYRTSEHRWGRERWVATIYLVSSDQFAQRGQDSNLLHYMSCRCLVLLAPEIEDRAGDVRLNKWVMLMWRKAGAGDAMSRMQEGIYAELMREIDSLVIDHDFRLKPLRRP